MHVRLTARSELTKRLVIAAGVVLAVAVLGALLQPVFPARGAAQNAPAVQQSQAGPAAVLVVYPSVIKLPEAGKRKKRVGVWLVGGGLEAGQEFTIRIRWNSESLEQDVTPFMTGYNEETGAIANIHGAFTLGMGEGFQDFRAPRRDLFFQGVFEPITFRLHDAVTGELLAVAPLAICGPNREQKLCNAAQDLVPLK